MYEINDVSQISNLNSVNFVQNKENDEDMNTKSGSHGNDNGFVDNAITLDHKIDECSDLDTLKRTSNESKELLSHNCEELAPLQSQKNTPNQTNRIVCKESEFYKKAQDYWSHIPPTVNGMLGGLGYISAIDIQGSANFLRELRIADNKFALDCGSGIGRVTKNLLMPRFDCVDMVEQDEKFANAAKTYCTNDAGSTLGYPNRLGEIYNMGLQEFIPIQEKYDLIWSQWVLGHLTDEDLLAFFCRIRAGLKSGGYFVMKENVTSSKKKGIEKDDTDSSVTRPLRIYEKIIHKAGLKIVKTTRQLSLPKGLYPVFMIACRVQK